MKLFLSILLLCLSIASYTGTSQIINPKQLNKIKHSLNLWLNQYPYPFSNSENAQQMIKVVKASGLMESDSSFFSNFDSTGIPYLSFFIHIDSIYSKDKEYVVDITIKEYTNIGNYDFMYSFPYYIFEANNYDNKINPIFFTFKKISSSLLISLNNIVINLNYFFKFESISVTYDNYNFDVKYSLKKEFDPQMLFIDFDKIYFLVLDVKIPGFQTGLKVDNVKKNISYYTGFLKEFCDIQFAHFNDTKNNKRYLSVSPNEFFLQGVEKLITGKQHFWEVISIIFEPYSDSQGNLLMDINLSGNWLNSPSEPEDTKVILDKSLNNHLDIKYEKELRAFGFNLQLEFIKFLEQKNK